MGLDESFPLAAMQLREIASIRSSVKIRFEEPLLLVLRTDPLGIESMR